MNLLLLQTQDIISDNKARITDERLQHIRKVLKAQPGDQLTAGMLNGAMGTAHIDALHEDSIELSLDLQQSPPAPLPLTVILALSRPKMLRRILKNTAELGIKELYLINSYKVEKSYWQTPWLQIDNIQRSLCEGLEQAKDTRLPRVHQKRLFKPFVEDELPGIIANKQAYVAHPYEAAAMPSASSEERVIVIGPEGGFIPYEVDLLRQQGLQAISMGDRIYRVENALTLLSTQLSKPD